MKDIMQNYTLDNDGKINDFVKGFDFSDFDYFYHIEIPMNNYVEFSENFIRKYLGLKCNGDWIIDIDFTCQTQPHLSNEFLKENIHNINFNNLIQCRKNLDENFIVENITLFDNETWKILIENTELFDSISIDFKDKFNEFLYSKT